MLRTYKLIEREGREMDLIIFTMAAVVMGSIIWLVVPIVLGLVVSAFLLVFWSIKFLIELAFGSDDNGQ